MEEKAKFKIMYLEEAVLFLESLSQKVQDKISYNIEKCMYYPDVRLFKKLENSNIWEFRTLNGGKSYRLFAFWDKTNGSFVIATHGIVKKSQKTPQKEIAKAEAIRKRYFEQY